MLSYSQLRAGGTQPVTEGPAGRTKGSKDNQEDRTMAQQMQTRSSRPATPERWQRALERAQFAGVEAKQLAGSGEWIVSSASRPGVAYRTDGIACDCEAAMLGGDPVCLHRAAYWYAQGVLELNPEPESPASAAPVLCFRCHGAEAGCPVCHGAD